MPKRKFDPWEVRPESAGVGVVGKAKAAIGILADHLKSKEFKEIVGIKVSEVFKGGSLGQGTQVPYSYDIDLVVYVEDLTIDDVLTTGYKELLDKTREFLENQRRGRNYDYHRVPVNGEWVCVGIQFIYPFFDDDKEISIDLFLCPKFSSPRHLLSELQKIKDTEKRNIFSVSASKWQTGFLSRQKQWVKEFSRRLKAWRDITWKDSKDGRPSSYLLVILVVIAFKRLPADKQKIKKRKMNRIVPLMTEKLSELVFEIESTADLDLSVPGANMELQKTYEDLLLPCPRIIDPKNPANNLYISGVKRSKKEDNNWTPFAQKVANLNIGPDIMKEHEKYIKGK